MPAQDLVNEVTGLRSQGLGNDEIVQRLLYKGYSNAAIFDAMSETELTPALESSSDTMDYQELQPTYNQGYAEVQSSPAPTVDASKISEIAESIIEEKWSDLIDHVNRIIEWKSSMEIKLTSMDEQIKGLRADFESLQKGVLGRINDSDSTMREVGTDIKALEQVFKKILPGFVENVNELSRITQSLKKK